MKSFQELYNNQIEFQQLICNTFGYGEKLSMALPKDKPDICSFHVQQLISEIGEILSADKRWKTYRNEHIDMANKKEEIADCFIVLMNIAIFSNMRAEDIIKSIEEKIEKNFKRVKGEE